MKTVTVNKVKFKVFEEKELKEKFNLKDDEVKLILDYQRLFPELLQDEEGFVINGEVLCKQLGVKSEFTEWLKANRKSKIGKLIKYNCIENKDYVEIREVAKNSKSGRNKTIIMLTLDCAKKIAMRQNDKLGDLVCDYFILMEKTLRKNEEWNMIRGVEKQGFKEMTNQLSEWVIRNNHDINDIKTFAIRECNMINVALTGMKAMDIRYYFKAKDRATRDHLDTERNKVIDELQKLNANLLISDLSFDTRKLIIENTCKARYSHLHIDNSENII